MGPGTKIASKIPPIEVKRKGKLSAQMERDGNMRIMLENGPKRKGNF